MKHDYRSSGLGVVAGTAVDARGHLLLNAAERVDMHAGATAQVHLCSCCGIPMCVSGGWVAMRRAGELVLWIPAWQAMDEDKWKKSDYAPPPFMYTAGPAAFSEHAWNRLRELAPDLPALMELPRLTSYEAARILQFSAPEVLGKYPEPPRVHRDLLICTSNGDVGPQAERVARVLRDAFTTRAPVALTSVPAARPIDFFLDLPNTPCWAPLAIVEGEARIQIGDMVCIPALD